MEDHFAAEHVQFGSRPYIILEMVKFFRNLAKMLQGYVVLVAEYADRTERDNILERVEPAVCAMAIFLREYCFRPPVAGLSARLGGRSNAKCHI